LSQTALNITHVYLKVTIWYCV